MILEPISDQAAFQLDQTLYLLGGKTQYCYLYTLVEKHSGNRFCKCAGMEEGRSCIGFSGSHNILLAAGGQSQFGVVKEVEKYDVSLNQWQSFPSLNYERRWPGLWCYRNEISNIILAFCFCGIAKNKLKSIEKYNHASRQWIKLATQEGVSANFHLKVVSSDQKLLVFGGPKQGDQLIKSMSFYDSQGKLVKNFDEGGFIPTEQGAQPHFVDKYDRLFTVVKCENEEKIWMFDGEWNLVN